MLGGRVQGPIRAFLLIGLSALAGATASGAVAPYAETFVFQGHFDCSLGTLTITAACTWPYTAAYLALEAAGADAGGLGLPADLQDNRYRTEFPVAEGAVDIVSELAWPDGPAALYLVLSCDEYDPVLDDCNPRYAEATGPSPLRVTWSAAQIGLLPDGVMARAYLPFDGAQAEFDFDFTIANTVFYGAPAPSGFHTL